ncbi:TPA: hypothetical protein ACJ2X1_003849 [Yersinia enterocolitica]|uniref:Uncharacterized protein n=1 Tax=Yersinia frederiksenii TaxID=29484 RepID=A0AAI9ENT1_YERFR|nr:MULTISPECIES: hypothetical protein [Yersinia]ELI8285659.1 hypothetical protein [Yersinia enterocolitica]MDN0104516.1 hypothetical protein [Yersinia bercovieri]CFQ96998.1 Uncharacterised protein [Yersinia frederiksenii]
MRTYGRNSEGQWVLVETDDNGFNDSVYLTTLIQNLKLAPQESPFYANNGIPANGSVIQQILPTYYVNRIQQQFSQYFSSLQIAMVSDDPPIYNISAITNAGSKIITQVNV